MTSRLVLGCGSLGRTLARRLRQRPGSLLVLAADRSRADTLRDDNVPATQADITDPAAVAEAVSGTPDTVVVGCDDPESNLTAARAAREVFPGAFLLASTGLVPTREQVSAIEAVADRIVDRDREIARAIHERVGDEGLRMRRLRRVLRDVEGTLAVVTHDNPDPDAIASAVALSRIAEEVGVEAEVLYYGDITHQENLALVNVLEFDLANVDSDADLSSYGGFALVDHSRPGVNDQLPPDTPVDVVIDHHPPRAPVEARFVDLRSHVGATSTLLAGYLRQLNVEPTREVATGLLFGIRVDTRDFSREVTPEDFEAAAHLLPYADVATLERVEDPSISVETFEILGRAIEYSDVQDDVLTASVGRVTDRDALAQAADKLLNREGVTTTLIYGYSEDTVFVSARARGTDRDLGEALRDAFGQIGSAGGHADMAGAQIPVGALVEADETDEERDRVIREVVRERFYETLGVGPDRAAAAVYAVDGYLGTGSPAVRFHRSTPLGEGSAAATADVGSSSEDREGDATRWTGGAPGEAGTDAERSDGRGTAGDGVDERSDGEEGATDGDEAADGAEAADGEGATDGEGETGDGAGGPDDGEADAAAGEDTEE